MGKKSIQVRIKSSLYEAALKESQTLNCRLKPVAVLESCIEQGFEMLECLKHCQQHISKEEYPSTRALIDSTIRRCQE
jgi:hypothetical protein